jgi:hypothetical protein
MENTENNLSLKDRKLFNKKLKIIINISDYVFVFQMVFILIVLMFVFFDY